MKKKIIFLDFDGVLNSVRSVTADQKLVNALHAKQNFLIGVKFASGFDPIAVKLLWQLIEKTDAYIVISSSWRITINLGDIRNIFHAEFGWPDGDGERIIGVTGRRTTPYSCRGDEIQDWIDDHTTGIRNFQYIIIDDGGDFLDHQKKRFIQTDPYEGLLYKDYTKAMNLFGETIDEEKL